MSAQGLVRSVVAACALALTVLACLIPASASASSSPCSGCSAWWHVTSGARPTYLPPAKGEREPGVGQIVVIASNLGDAPVDGEASPVTITDTLPESLVAELGAGKVVAKAGGGGQGRLGAAKCSVVKNVPSCVFEHELPPYGQIEMIVDVKIEEGARSGEANAVSVSGGNTPAASVTHKIVVANPGEKTPFGIEQDELTNVNAEGASDTLAGSHPFETTFTTGVNQSFGGVSSSSGSGGKPEALPAALAKDLFFKLPPGLVGNPTPFAQCSLAQFFAKPLPTCSSQTVLGVATITFDEPGVLGLETVSVPVYNLEPEKGEPARFGFLVTSSNPVFIDTSVRSGADYGIMGRVQNITQTAGLIFSEVTFWGTPGSPRHNSSRDYDCLGGALDGAPTTSPCTALEENNPPPFFELPSSCSGPMVSSVEGDSWTEQFPLDALPTLASTTLPALSGCNGLPFHPSISVTPDGHAASSAAGLTVDVHNPQQESLNAEGAGEADVRDITVALPEGVAVNPSGGDGLQACSEGLVGFEREAELSSQPGFKTDLFKGWLPGSVTAKEMVEAGEIPAGEGTFEQGINFCANASKIGTATIRTPLLSKPLEGAVYLATQNANPFGSLIAMYIVAEEEASGVLVKLAGSVHLTSTGQLVSTFENSPQAPFEDAELHFFGGERAPLATPAHCGAYTTTASFVPWSAEPWDETAVTAHAESTFDITSGPNGTPCPGASLPFSPSLTGGSTNINAGSFTPLSTTIGREDGNQNMSQVTLHFPAGLSGELANVSLCGEQQANEGKCPESSLIGETTVSAGVGSDPVSVTGGKVYITGPYHGAPFGLSIVNPVKAGPFDLEHDTSNPNQDPACDCVVVRAKIEVNRETATLTITTNRESEGYAIPHLIDGIPVQIKKVNVLVGRAGGFTFNPTNCNRTEITGSIESDEGASSPVSVPLQVTNCKALKFEPSFRVSTQGNGKANGNGASLNVKLSARQGPQSEAAGTGEANIAKVDVSLPVALSSRLKVLQKACTEAQFATNPAGCPAASDVGTATVHTPLLPVPLTGPAYFVSHGGEAFPDLVMVLQGYGVTVNLVGHTKITNGITYTKFEAVPDAPVQNFELNLPEGPDAILGAIKNLCAPTRTETVKEKVAVKRHGHTVHVTKKVQKQVPETLIMPTEMTGQNGTPFKQETKVSVTGCPKAKPAKKAKAKKKGKKGKK